MFFAAFSKSTEETLVPPIEETKTKPRRKRRKKKKKKGKKQNDVVAIPDSDDDSSVGDIFVVSKIDASNSNESDVATSHISTPQEVLRHRLVESDGYRADCVDKAMEEMWEKGLPYDEYSAVVLYLEGDRNQVEEKSPTKNVAPVVVNKDSRSNEDEIVYDGKNEDYDTESTETESPLSHSFLSTDCMASISDGGDSLQASTQNPEGPVSTEDCNVDNDDMNKNTADAQPNSPTTLADKLIKVAEYEDLGDVLFVMTKWVWEAAKPHEVEDLCIAVRTPALPTVIRRVISYEIQDSVRFETIILPGLMKLLASVLQRCGVVEELGGEHGSEHEKWMEKMLKQARELALMSKDETINDSNDAEKADIADRVSWFIVSQMRIALEKIKGVNGATKEEPKTNVVVTDHTRSKGPGSSTERNGLKLIASLANTTVMNAMQNYSNGVLVNGDESHSTQSIISNIMINDELSPSFSSPLDNDDTLLLLVNPSTKKRFEEDKAKLKTMKAKVRPSAEESEKVQFLLESVLELETERTTYKMQIEVLRAALEELEDMDDDAAFQIEELSAQIEEENKSDIFQAKRIEKEIRTAEKSVDYGNMVGSLAEMMNFYGNALEEATSAKKSVRHDTYNKSENCSEDYLAKISTSAAMEDFLSKTRLYFLAEAKHEAQLRSRIAAKTTELASLRSELSQYKEAKGIGSMTTIISQIEESIPKKEMSLKEDICTSDALIRDSKHMYNELLARLEEYQSKIVSSESKSDSLPNMFPTALLWDVPAAIRALNIVDSCVPLEKFIDKQPASSGTNQFEAKEDDSVVSGANDSAEDYLKLEASSSTNSLAPPKVIKLSWANEQPALASDAEKHSLLDIQREQQMQ
ncbi:unnamed protein product [Pseudo-nitzschia multistriata]|uniref:Uncharacterized protein n=1 Tax=Pseudo-nitzschia multistriata TaxID=183589 RepID=A0A448ZD39_9STRA|nr:unnamed protein product [Pseudo-nitzschia multistriata]